jgi:hypothetical protein
MDQQTKFVILAGPRTGSTYLVDYLNALPETLCHSELFQENRIDFRHRPPEDPRLQDLIFRDAEPVAFVDLALAEAQDCQLFGFKLIGNQIGPRGPDFLTRICGARSWKKIYLWRDDLLEQSISFVLAARHFGSDIWERTPDRQRVTIPPADLMDHLHMVQLQYVLIESALRNADAEDVFALDYQDLGRPAVMAGLLRFLGRPEGVIDHMTAGGGDQGLEFRPGPRITERVENHAQIRHFLMNSRYRRLIED